MSTEYFTVTEHVSPCAYIRQFPHGAKDDNAALRLAVKEYRPKNKTPGADSVTIIATHGIGFPKECYEPLWDELLNSPNGLDIRSIWIADVAHQGASYALNEGKLGDDPNWTDHSRDLFLMINNFRDRMSPPFVGIGHSMGSLQLVELAQMHRRLFHSLILLEPVIQDFPPPGPNAGMFPSFRREIWDSRELAEKQISKNGFFQSMDPRVLKLYLSYALKDLPNGKTVLVTPKSHEAWSYIRPHFQPLTPDVSKLETRKRERLMNPEYKPHSQYSVAMFTRPEGLLTLEHLPNLRPHTLFLYGEYSHINFDEIREMHLKDVGTGHSGNGGVADGGVEECVLDDVGHLCCFENPSAVANVALKYLQKELVRWKEEKEYWATVDTGKSKNDRNELSDNWLKQVKEDANILRPVADSSSVKKVGGSKL